VSRLTETERAALKSIQARGYSTDIHGNTLKSLRAKGLIEHDGSADYRITKAGVDVVGALPAVKATRKPRPFSDSFTTVDAIFYVDVASGRAGRAKVEIDCNGAVFVDTGEIDVLIEMLENAKANLLARAA